MRKRHAIAKASGNPTPLAALNPASLVVCRVPRYPLRLMLMAAHDESPRQSLPNRLLDRVVVLENSRMKFGELFDHIILCAQESKTLYELNAESESFARLDEIVKSINLLREFYDKYETLVRTVRQPTNDGC